MKITTLLLHFYCSRTDKEIFDEIMKDAIAELERKKSVQKAKKRHRQGSKSSALKTSGHKVTVSDTAACDSLEAASCSHSNIAGYCKVESNALSNPPLHAASQSAPPEPLPSELPPSSQLTCEVEVVHSSLNQYEEKTSNKKADKYPKECDAFGEKETDVKKNDLCKETTLKDAKLSDRASVNKGLDQADLNNNLTRNGDVSFSKTDSRDDDRGTTGPLETPLVQNETVLKKAKRHVHLVRKKLKRAKGKESSKPKEEDDGHQSTPGQVPPLSDVLSHCETRCIPSADTSPPPDTTDPEASIPGDAAGSRTAVVVKDVESSNPIQKNHHESEVCLQFFNSKALFPPRIVVCLKSTKQKRSSFFLFYTRHYVTRLYGTVCKEQLTLPPWFDACVCISLLFFMQ